MAIPDFIKQMQELSQDPKSIKTEQLNELMRKSLVFFDELQKQIHSKNLEDQQAAQKILADLKEALEEQAKLLCENFGIEPSQIGLFLDKPENLTNEEIDALETAKKEVELRKEQLAPRSLKKTQKLIFS